MADACSTLRTAGLERPGQNTRTTSRLARFLCCFCPDSKCWMLAGQLDWKVGVVVPRPWPVIQSGSPDPQAGERRGLTGDGPREGDFVRPLSRYSPNGHATPVMAEVFILSWLPPETLHLTSRQGVQRVPSPKVMTP
ncbi:uncharacterized protein AAES06_002803 [Glossophaga mutica]